MISYENVNLLNFKGDVMVNSNSRKLSLSGWLQNNNESAYDNSLRLQKFLFFYETFSKINDDSADFSYLKGYKMGPVFSNVWGDYTKERKLFDVKSNEEYQRSGRNINDEWAKRAAFIVSIMSGKELSDLTHVYHIWNCKKELIDAGYLQVPLSESDFSDSDIEITKKLELMYPIDMINNSAIINFDETHFILNMKDAAKISEEHMDILCNLSSCGELHNPVYVEIKEDGGLIVD